MRQLTAFYDAPLPAAAARRALSVAGFAAADIDHYAVPPGETVRPRSAPAHADTPRGDLAAEIALRCERHAAERADGLSTAIAEALAARGVPAARVGELAGRVAEGRGWLVGVVCPDLRADLARRALLGSAPVAFFAS